MAAPRDVEAVAAALDDARYAVREGATLALMRGEVLTAGDVAELFKRAATAEARHRVLRVAYHHAIRRMAVASFGVDGGFGPFHQGAIGVVLREGGFDDQGGSIRVGDTLPGFPGEAWLLSGDEIVALDGERLPPGMAAGEFTQAIQQKGTQPVTLRVRRGGEELDLRVPLTSAVALTGLYFTDDITGEPRLQPWLENQWREELRALLATAPAVTRLE